jgi:hypothetical protein
MAQITEQELNEIHDALIWDELRRDLQGGEENRVIRMLRLLFADHERLQAEVAKARGDVALAKQVRELPDNMALVHYRGQLPETGEEASGWTVLPYHGSHRDVLQEFSSPEQAFEGKQQEAGLLELGATNG